MDPSGPSACWPIAARPPASGGGILGCEAAGIRAHVLLCLLRAEAVAGAGCGVQRRPSGGRPGGSRRKKKELYWWKESRESIVCELRELKSLRFLTKAVSAILVGRLE